MTNDKLPEQVMIDGELREVIPCPDNKPDCEVLHTKPTHLAGAGTAASSDVWTKVFNEIEQQADGNKS